MTRLTFVRWATLGFAAVFIATTLAALALFRFEAIAIPLVLGSALALPMIAAARRMAAPRGSMRALAEVEELTRVNVGVFALTLPLVGVDAWFTCSHSSLLFVTGALSLAALAHAALVLGVAHAAPTRATLRASYSTT